MTNNIDTSPEAIVHALETIKAVCKNQMVCTDCPLRVMGDNLKWACGVLREDKPRYWGINALDTWKAF